MIYQPINPTDKSTNSAVIGGGISAGDVANIPNVISEECSLAKVAKSPDGNCEVCMTNKSIEIIKSAVESQTHEKLPNDPVKIVEKAEEVLHVDTQRELVKKVVHLLMVIWLNKN